VKLNEMFTFIHDEQALPWRDGWTKSAMSNYDPVPAIQKLPEKRLKARQGRNNSPGKRYPFDQFVHSLLKK